MFGKGRIKELEQENETLKKRISDLENSVKHHRIRSALIDKTQLPKAKSVACYNCKYAAYVRYGKSGLAFLGCGRALAKGGCDGFEYTDANRPSLEEIGYFMATEGKDWQPSQVLSQYGVLANAQTPPCHEL